MPTQSWDVSFEPYDTNSQQRAFFDDYPELRYVKLERLDRDRNVKLVAGLGRPQPPYQYEILIGAPPYYTRATAPGISALPLSIQERKFASVKATWQRGEFPERKKLSVNEMKALIRLAQSVRGDWPPEDQAYLEQAVDWLLSRAEPRPKATPKSKSKQKTKSKPKPRARPKAKSKGR